MKTFSSILVFLFFITFSLTAQNKFELISIPVEDAQLEAVVVYPKDHFEGLRPCILFLPGSGPNSVTPYEGKGWALQGYYLEEIFLPKGYIIVYLNKRGLGTSTGDWRKNDFYGRAADAKKARDYLKKLPQIDAQQIGLAGHSQGGWISQIVAAQDKDIPFIISFAGPTINVMEQNIHTETLNWKCEGISTEKIKKKTKKRTNWLNFSAKLGKVLPFIKDAKYWSLIQDYDNDEILKKVACKTLLLFAEYDSMVLPKENLEHLTKLFKGTIPSNIQTLVMPQGNHAFSIAPDTCFDLDDAIFWKTENPFSFSEVFRQQIEDWAEEHIFSTTAASDNK